jgi:hypothetical protein
MPPEVHLHSDVQEIMVTKPSLALQWGNVFITGLVLLLLAFAAWFQYPELITTEISLAAQHPPDSLVAPAGNRGALLLVRQGAWVREGTPLVAWQDADHTNYHEVQRLKRVLDKATTTHLAATELARLLRPIQAVRLGPLRPSYEALMAASSTNPALVEQALAASQAQLRHWQQVAVALAPRAGLVEMGYAAWPAGTPIPAGQAALYLLPAQATYVAIGNINREQYATVRKGQQALVQVHELGSELLTGRVMEVAPLARHQQHQVLIAVAQPAKQHLYPSFSGYARIILKQQSLLAKLVAH